jgi:hypothetical protein
MTFTDATNRLLNLAIRVQPLGEVVNAAPCDSTPGAVLSIADWLLGRGITTTNATEEGRTRSVRVLARRRRVLIRKGVRIHGSMLAAADLSTLAILDANGVVVSWYEGENPQAVVGRTVLNRHVAQFYTPNSTAKTMANDHLRTAMEAGESTQSGWRRNAEGALFWAVTTIRPLLLRDGRVQGFSHVMRSPAGPTVVMDCSPRLPWRSARFAAVWQRPGIPAWGSLVASHRRAPLRSGLGFAAAHA